MAIPSYCVCFQKKKWIYLFLIIYKICHVYFCFYHSVCYLFIVLTRKLPFPRVSVCLQENGQMTIMSLYNNFSDKISINLVQLKRISFWIAIGTWSAIRRGLSFPTPEVVKDEVWYLFRHFISGCDILIKLGIGVALFLYLSLSFHSGQWIYYK